MTERTALSRPAYSTKKLTQITNTQTNKLKNNQTKKQTNNKNLANNKNHKQTNTQLQPCAVKKETSGCDLL